MKRFRCSWCGRLYRAKGDQRIYPTTHDAPGIVMCDECLDTAVVIECSRSIESDRNAKPKRRVNW